MEFDLVCNEECEEKWFTVPNQLYSGQTSNESAFASLDSECNRFDSSSRKVRIDLVTKWFTLRRSHFLGTTILSSSGVSRSVKQPGTRRPGVSYRTFPPDRLTLMNWSVVPGSGDVVTLPFHLFALPARILPFFLDAPSSSRR